MKKKILLSALLFSFCLLIPGLAGAAGSDLPEENDPFWTITGSLNRPNDPTCQSKTEALLTSLGLPGGTERAVATCAGVARMMEMESAMSSDGVSSNLFDQTDWHHVQNLYFDAPEGRIAFTNEIDFMSRSFLLFLETITSRLGMDQDEIALDADIVNGMRGYGAVLTMKNASDFNEPEILVNDAADNEGVVSGLNYDRTSNTITFNAAHFTTFKAVEKGSALAKQPKITKVEFAQYKSHKGKTKIKMTISGRNLTKNTKVRLGRQYADNIKYSSSKKIKAYFTLSDLRKKHPSESLLTLKLKNDNGLSKKFSKLINYNLRSGKLTETN